MPGVRPPRADVIARVRRSPRAAFFLLVAPRMRAPAFGSFSSRRPGRHLAGAFEPRAAAVSSLQACHACSPTPRMPGITQGWVASPSPHSSRSAHSV